MATQERATSAAATGAGVFVAPPTKSAANSLDHILADLEASADFNPVVDDTVLAGLKRKAEAIKAEKKENVRLQRNERRKEQRLRARVAKMSRNDILAAFRLRQKADKKRRDNQEHREAAAAAKKSTTSEGAEEVPE